MTTRNAKGPYGWGSVLFRQCHRGGQPSKRARPGLIPTEATIGGFAFAVAVNYRPAGMNPAVAKNTWLTYLFFSPSSILTKPSRILATRSLGPVALIKIKEPSFNSRMAPSIL